MQMCNKRRSFNTKWDHEELDRLIFQSQIIYNRCHTHMQTVELNIRTRTSNLADALSMARKTCTSNILTARDMVTSFKISKSTLTSQILCLSKQFSKH